VLISLFSVAGAREGGAGGFAKGLGKGLIGVVARPASGVVDFASSTIDAVKTAAGLNDETKPLRPPRVILSDQIVRPYSYKDAIGYKIFCDTDRGKFADTDHFVTYGLISEKYVFIVTDQRVIFAKRQDVIGVWTADWTMGYGEINPPTKTPKGVTLEPKHKKKGFLGIGGSRGKTIQFSDANVAATVGDRLIAAYNQYA
jgi:vacuolar protein sorting-associated protein 13A/C